MKTVGMLQSPSSLKPLVREVEVVAASGSNLEVSKKGPALPLVPLLIFGMFMAQCGCVRMRRGKGKLRTRRNTGEQIAWKPRMSLPILCVSVGRK